RVRGVREATEPEYSEIAVLRVVRVRLERDRVSRARLRGRRAHREDPEPVELVALAELVDGAAGEKEGENERSARHRPVHSIASTVHRCGTPVIGTGVPQRDAGLKRALSQAATHASSVPYPRP